MSHVLEQFSLKGKVALLTGGAGKYGRQLVAALAEAGAQTLLASRNVEALEKVADEHRKLGHDVTVFHLDQGEESSILALRDQIQSKYGRLDVLVNNSVSRPMTQAYQSPAATFAESMKVNATGLFLITRAMGDMMAEKKKGSIVNIGSIHGMIAPDPTIYRGTDMSGFYPDYFFHKGGMINFTRFTASYYGASNIRCNSILPGGFQTASHPEAFIRQYSDRTLLGRLANDNDLKGALVFFASDASSYITGTNLPVDAGYTAK